MTATPDEKLALATDAAVVAGLDRATINATVQPATAVDAQGIERIVSTPRAGGFTPAPVGPDPAAVRRAEAFADLQDAQRDARTAALTTPAGATAEAAGPDQVEEPAPAAPTPPAATSAPTPPSTPSAPNVSSAPTTSGSGSSTGTV